MYFLRESPKTISERLSDLSSNKETFQKATSICFEALKKSGLNETLVFIPRTKSSDNTSDISEIIKAAFPKIQQFA